MLVPKRMQRRMTKLRSLFDAAGRAQALKSIDCIQYELSVLLSSREQPDDNSSAETLSIRARARSNFLQSS